MLLQSRDERKIESAHQSLTSLICDPIFNGFRNELGIEPNTYGGAVAVLRPGPEAETIPLQELAAWQLTALPWEFPRPSRKDPISYLAVPEGDADRVRRPADTQQGRLHEDRHQAAGSRTQDAPF